VRPASSFLPTSPQARIFTLSHYARKRLMANTQADHRATTQNSHNDEGKLQQRARNRPPACSVLLQQEFARNPLQQRSCLFSLSRIKQKHSASCVLLSINTYYEDEERSGPLPSVTFSCSRHRHLLEKKEPSSSPPPPRQTQFRRRGRGKGSSSDLVGIYIEDCINSRSPPAGEVSAGRCVDTHHNGEYRVFS